MKKIVKRVVAWMLAVCMFMSGMGTGMLTASAEESKEDIIVINVTDYGADPSGSKDSARAIQDAIEAVKVLNGQPAVLNFPTGEYQIYPDYSQKRELYVSNTCGTDQSLKNKTIGILLEDMDNVTIEGNDSMFMFHGKMTTFTTIGCTNITFQNFAMDFQTPTVIDLTVEERGSNYAVVYVPDCYDYTVNGSNISWFSDTSPYTGKPYWTATNKLVYTQRYDLASGETWRGDTTHSPLFNSVASIQDLGNHRVKFNYNNSPDSEIQPGLCYQMRNTVRDTPGTLIWESKDILLKDLDVHYLHGFGMVGQFSENLTYDGLKFKTPVNSGRTTAGYADFVQMSGCKGLVDIKNCLFSNPHDDPINIHGTFLKIVEKIASNKVKVRYMHPETAGFPNYYVGDQVEFMTVGNMVPVTDSVRTVTAVEGPNPGSLTDMVVTFDKDIPTEVGVNTHVVENVTYTPEVKITNNVFQSVPTRGILVTTRKPILIENNYFDSMNMPAIYISNDANGWFESGPTSDVTIRNNVFDKCASGVINYDPTGTPDVNRPVHSNSLIENNVFNLEDGQLISAKSVGNMIFRGNTINRFNPGVAIELSSNKKVLKLGETAKLTAAKKGNSLGSNLFNFYACNRVNLSGNKYDGGLNLRANIGGGMSSNSQYINIASDENVKIAEDNRADAVGTILYKSSDESVVFVSPDGTLTAKAEGSAVVSAYSVLAGRSFESNELKIYVGEGQIVLPGSVSISSDADELTASGATMQFTSEVLPGNADNKELEWSVLDPVTREVSAAAEITQNGLLTARSEAAVLVQAKAVNQVKATKLINITLPPSPGLKPGFSIIREDKTGWKLDENKDAVSILAQGNSLWATGNSVKNLILANPAGGKDNVTATLKLSGKTHVNYEEPGIIFYKDDDNYTTVQRKHGAGSPIIAVVNEVGGSPNEDGGVTDIAAQDIYFKLQKEGASLTGYYSGDGAVWTKIRTVTNTGLGNDYKVGLIAGGGNSTDWFTFQDLVINDTNYGFKNTNQSPAAGEVSYALPDLGKAATGDLVGVTYTYTDPDSDAEGNTLVCWLTSDTENGIYTPTATGREFTVPAELAGKYIKAAVVPEDVKGKRGALVYGGTIHVEGGKSINEAEIYAEEGQALQEQDAVKAGDTPVLSADAYLKTADVEGAAFGEFHKTTKYYVTTAEASLEQVNIRLETEHKDASIRVAVNEQVLTESGKQKVSLEKVPLIANHNIIEVTVTSPDGVDKGYYRFIIMRKGYDNKELSSVTLDGSPVTGFDANVTEYSIALPSSKTVHLEAAKAHASSEIAVTAGSVRTEGNAADVVLVSGTNRIVVTVKPDTNSVPRYYVFNIKVAKEDENRLESMKFSNSVTLKEAFEPEVLSYSGASGSKNADLTLRAMDPGARIAVYANGQKWESTTDSLAVPLSFYKGVNSIAVCVTAANGSQRAYMVQLMANSVVYADNTNWESATTGWGTIHIDAEVEGSPLTLLNEKNETVVYPKGIGTHATSEIRFNVEGKGYERFQSYVGVDYSMGGRGAVTFSITADGKEVYNSKELTSGSQQGWADVELSGVKELVLNAEKGDSDANDHANWADAKFVCPLDEREDSTQYTVTASATGRGKVLTTAAGGKVYKNDSMILTFVPDKGESLTQVKVNEKLVKVNEKNQYVISKAVENIKVEAAFTESLQVTQIQIKPSVLSLEAGKTAVLTATVLPENAADKSFIWKSEDSKIAVVDQTGKVTAVSKGTVRILAVTPDEKVSGSCMVTVTETAPECTCKIENIRLEKAGMDLEGKSSAGLELQAKSDVTSCGISGHAGKSVSYVYEVAGDTTGTAVIAGSRLTVSKAGEVSIRIKAAITGTDASASNVQKVKIINTIPVTQIQVSPSALNLEVGKTAVLTATVLPENAADKSFTWKSEDSRIATVDQTGKVTALSAGTVRILAAAPNQRITGTAVITVTNKPAPPAVYYKVTFDPAGGKVSPASIQILEGYALGKFPTPMRSGYVFKGWFNGAVPAKSTDICRANVTLTARWEKIQKPSKVTGLKASGQTTSRIKLSWKKADKADYYIIRRYEDASKKWTEVTRTKGTSYTDNKKKAGAKYRYKVAAVNAGGAGSYSATIRTAAAPKAPSIKVKSAGSGKVKISWSKLNADRVVIYMKKGSGKYQRLISKSSKALFVTKNGFKKTKYTFRAKAYAEGTSDVHGAYSKPKSITVKK